MKNKLFGIIATAMAIFMLLPTVGCRKNAKYESIFLSGEYSDITYTDGNEEGNTSNSHESGTNSSSNITGSNNNISGSKDKDGKDIVVVAVNSNRPTDIQPLFDALYKAYPDINVKIDYYTSDDAKASQEYIGAKSAIGQLPDVVFDDIANLSLYVSQGLVYPLNDFVNKDPDYKYVPASIMENYTYDGRIYALPHQAYFTCLTLNLDVLDALNVDIPELDWNFDDMIAFAKKVSNEKYCFAENLTYLDYYGAGSYSADSSICGYNVKTRKYEMTDSFAKAMESFRILRETPNVEGWSLKLTGVYSQRFGSNDTWAATKQGKTVMTDFSKGTYSFNTDLGGGFKSLLQNQNYIFHPFPQEIKGRMPVHIDHAWMVSSTKVPDSAFKVLSFLTYSAEGNKARINAYLDARNGKSKYKLNLDYYTPVTKHPDVVSSVKKLYSDDEAQLYMYNNIDNCFRGDLDKFVPSWGQHWSDIINPVATQVQDGLKDPVSTCKDLQIKATNSIEKYWKDFEEKHKKVMQKWDATH